MWSSWVYRVVHNTCTMQGRDIKTQYIGSTSILQFGKDWHSIRRDRMPSSLKKHFLLIVFRKLLEWKLEKSDQNRYTSHFDLRHRSHWNTNGKNWVQNMLNDHKSGNYLGVSKRTHQFQIQVVRERWDPMLKYDPRTMQDGSKMSLSQEIDLHSYSKNLLLQSEQGDPLLKRV